MSTPSSLTLTEPEAAPAARVCLVCGMPHRPPPEAALREVRCESCGHALGERVAMRRALLAALAWTALALALVGFAWLLRRLF